MSRPTCNILMIVRVRGILFFTLYFEQYCVTYVIYIRIPGSWHQTREPWGTIQLLCQNIRRYEVRNGSKFVK